MIGIVAALAHPLPLALVTAGFGWWLLLIAALDLEQQWLPDLLTLPLLPLGLARRLGRLRAAARRAAIGAAIGWASLVAIAFLYRRLRGREGMGGGDPKMFGAVGAWVGAWNLPAILLAAGLIGLAAVLAMRLRGQAVSATTRLPLGTLMALAAWPAWLLVANLNPKPFSLRPYSPCHTGRLRAASIPRGAARLPPASHPAQAGTHERLAGRTGGGASACFSRSVFMGAGLRRDD